MSDLTKNPRNKLEAIKELQAKHITATITVGDTDALASIRSATYKWTLSAALSIRSAAYKWLPSGLTSIRSATYKWLASGLTSIRSATYKWTASGSGTDEFYLELAAGGDPSISPEPNFVYENGAPMASGTMGSLTAGQWDYGDNDTLGYSTVYVRLTATGDPDGQAAGFVQYTDSDEHYLVLAAGGDPSISSEPSAVFENSTIMTNGTVGSLSAGEWDYGDNDTLGFNTVYVSLTATGDPDDQAADFVQYTATDEHYLELAAGGTPGILEPAAVYEDDVVMSEGTVGSLSAGEWDWGDNDSLGFSTVYVSLTATGDPDDQAAGFVTHHHDEYYLELAAGGDPSIAEPAGVYEDGTLLTEGTVGSLAAAGGWDYGDNDSLGYDTIYVRLAVTGDPDSQAAGFVQYSDIDSISVSIQLKDGYNNADLAYRCAVGFYLSDDANGDSVAGTAPDSLAIGTDGAIMEWTSNVSGKLISESDGDIDLTIGENGADTWYLILVMPDGSLVASGAITFV